ncbi:hypothetical protein BH20ACT6_BH20ACT6_19860 [soil metagenome]
MACTALLIGTARAALGDAEGAALEYEAARTTYARLGARPDLSRVPGRAAAGLTAREVQVLRLVAQGKTNRSIGTALGLSERTVDRHVSNILAKLGASSRVAATAVALQSARMLGRIDAIDADIDALDTEIEAYLAPFGDAAARLDEIPGIGPTAAALIIAEIGVDMTRFPTPGHLASWAKFAPGIKSSAGKNKGNASTGHGNRYLARVIGEAAVSSGRTNTFLGARYRRIARRRGKKKAIVAVGRSMLVAIWHVLSDPETRFVDLGADYYDRLVDTAAKKRHHIRQLQALGYTVTTEPAQPVA